MEANEQSALLQQVSSNAFRVLGLPNDASQKAIKERAAALDRAARVGTNAPSSPWDLKWYGPLGQDRTCISDALGRLSNPQQRLTERFFWIAQSHQFVAAISRETLDESTIAPLDASLSAGDRHDSAVLALVWCFLTDSDVQDAQGWRTTLQQWSDLLESEDFWSVFLDIEQSGNFEPAASLEDLNRLRVRSQRLAIGPLAELARDAASQSEFDRCRRALDIIRTSLFPSEIGFAAEESVLGPYEDALVRTSKEIMERCWEGIQQDRSSAERNAKACSVAVGRWKQDLEPRYRNFTAMSGTGSDAGLRARQEYADFLTRLGNAFSWAVQWVEAERFLILALSVLPAESPARERLEARLLDIGKAAAEEREEARAHGRQIDIGSFERLCEEIRAEISRLVNPAIMYATTDAVAACEQAYQRYDKAVTPWLSMICAANSEAGQLTIRAKAAAARCLLDIAEGFRYWDNSSRASDLMVAAAGLSPGGTERAAEIAPQHSRLYVESRNRSRANVAQDLDNTGSVDGFVRLCNVILAEYRKHFRRSLGLADYGKNLLALISAHDDYRQRASPWLAVILKSYDGNMPEHAGDAAAQCLSCLADGFIWVNDLDKAEVLAREALPLIDDAKLEAEVKEQLAQIATERQKSAAKPARNNHEGNTAGRSVASGNRTATSPPAGTAPVLFHQLGYREQILLAAAALLVILGIILPLTTHNEPHYSLPEVSSGGAPAGQPSAAIPSPESHGPTITVTPALRAVPAPAPMIYEAVPGPIPMRTLAETAPPTIRYLQRDPISLPNGTNLILPPVAEGLGELHINNNSSQDAVVKLKTVLGQETLWFVYVRALSTWVIPKIPVGSYFLEFATGRDWDADSQSFRQERAFAKFENSQLYTEVSDRDGITYSVKRVTLQPVPNGNAKTNSISAEEFGK